MLVPGETTERELPRVDLPIPAAMSADGKWLLFTDESASAGLGYAVAWRRTDGSPAVRLGDGYAVALSPDARWAVGRVSSPARHYIPASLDRIDVASGARTRVREVMPPDRLGIVEITIGCVSHDGAAYGYHYWRQTSKAILVGGIK